ncbi:Cystathionine beta-synthase [hydrothermal vent metagenome]|uniref:Cystathionine beta-synthase n=1 Tax=hydrothermal vent metagenome TaxID=652676 RepID=A0A3B1DLM0_9ZZZZ
MRKPFHTILDTIGDTPLVRLNKVVPEGAAEVWVKCEFLNPAGSIKDRMALYIVEEAEKRGWLKPGGTIVENTSGNTGLGLAMVAAVKGYKCIFTMPDKMSLEKVNMLKGFGAEVVITPTDVPGDSPEHYVNTAKRIAAETPGGFYVNQYHTDLNILAHYHSTGKEIWEQTEGDFDAFVAGIGTGGTISGVGRLIKEKNTELGKSIRVVGEDPIGSVHFSLFYTGTPGEAGVYKVEGIGDDIVCDAFDLSVVDEIRQTDDRQAFTLARRLTREEGLFCGGSSGAIAHVAIEIAKEMGPGKKVVCVLPDHGSRYISKYLSDAWMKDYGFLEPERNLGLVEDVLKTEQPTVITASPEATLAEIVQIFREHGVSQVPLVDGSGKPESIVHEVDLLRAMQAGDVSMDTKASEVATAVGGLIYPKARVEELYAIFAKDQVAIVVDQSRIVGIVSQIDLIDYLSHKTNA